MAKIKINFKDELLQKIEIIARGAKIPRDFFIQYLCAQQLLNMQNNNTGAAEHENNIDWNCYDKNGEVDMLEGNIGRICVTDDFDELDRMRLVAFERIENLYLYRKFVLEQRKEYNNASIYMNMVKPLDPGMINAINNCRTHNESMHVVQCFNVQPIGAIPEAKHL